MSFFFFYFKKYNLDKMLSNKLLNLIWLDLSKRKHYMKKLSTYKKFYKIISSKYFLMSTFLVGTTVGSISYLNLAELKINQNLLLQTNELPIKRLVF